MSKQAEADLILKLYDLRREATMRAARDWYFRDFNPQSFDDAKAALFGEHSGHLRMVLSYWDMAAGFVKNEAISLEMFNDANGEHFSVYTKVEPFIAEWRAAFGKNFLKNLEALVNATPDGKERVAEIKERMKRIMATFAEQQKAAAQKIAAK